MDKEKNNPIRKRRVLMPTLAIKKSTVPKTKECCLTKAKKEVLKELRLLFYPVNPCNYI
jgi:hypothetical protein